MQFLCLVQRANRKKNMSFIWELRRNDTSPFWSHPPTIPGSVRVSWVPRESLFYFHPCSYLVFLASASFHGPYTFLTHLLQDQLRPSYIDCGLDYVETSYTPVRHKASSYRLSLSFKQKEYQCQRTNEAKRSYRGSTWFTLIVIL